MRRITFAEEYGEDRSKRTNSARLLTPRMSRIIVSIDKLKRESKTNPDRQSVIAILLILNDEG